GPDVGDRRVGPQPQDLLVLGIPRVAPSVEAALEELDHALVPHRTLADARPHDGDGPRLEHGLERTPALGPRARRSGHAPGATAPAWPASGPAWPAGMPAIRGCRTRLRPRAWRTTRGTGPGWACGNPRSRGRGACGTTDPPRARRGRCCRRSARAPAPGRGVPAPAER